MCGEATKKNICIVGAGPGGIQLGQYLSTSRSKELQDYVIFERAAVAGNFFTRYPVHRGLISINKRFHSPGHTWEYGFRQDWNSLIGRPDVAPVTNRSVDFFPHADVLVEYLRDFAQAQVDAGKIEFNTNVDQVKKLEGGGFDVYVRHTAAPASARTVRCTQVVMAHGLHVPSPMGNLKMGADLMTDYNDMPNWDKDRAWWEKKFTGKDVAIFGMGNSAMEVAQAILPLTAAVHMHGRGQQRYSDETHYPGDIRAGRRHILDHFQLKMGSTYHPGVTGDVHVMKCLGNKLCLFTTPEFETMEFVAGGRGSEQAAQIIKMLEEKTKAGTLAKGEWEHKTAEYNQKRFDRAFNRNGVIKKDYRRMKLLMHTAQSYDTLQISLKALAKHQDLLDLFAKHRPVLTSDDARDPFDVIIRCTGWRHNMSVYHESNQPKLLPNGKHAMVTSNYESVNVPGLFFAGTMAHGPDFRKSAGGFIHGFRYSSRALLRVLERRLGYDWAAQTEYSLPTQRVKLEEKIFKRIATSSGPYHMFGGALVDAVVLMPNCTAVYFEEIPSKYLQEEFGNLPRMVWLFDYGDNDERERDEWELHPDVQYHQKAYLDGFLHPIFSFYGAGDTEPKYKAHMHADFFTRFNGAVAHHETMSQFLLQSMHDSFKSNPTCMALGGAKIVFGPKAGGCAFGVCAATSSAGGEDNQQGDDESDEGDDDNAQEDPDL